MIKDFKVGDKIIERGSAVLEEYIIIRMDGRCVLVQNQANYISGVLCPKTIRVPYDNFEGIFRRFYIQKPRTAPNEQQRGDTLESVKINLRALGRWMPYWARSVEAVFADLLEARDQEGWTQKENDMVESAVHQAGDASQAFGMLREKLGNCWGPVHALRPNSAENTREKGGLKNNE